MVIRCLTLFNDCCSKVALARFCLHLLGQKQCGQIKDRELSFQWRLHGIAGKERTTGKSSRIRSMLGCLSMEVRSGMSNCEGVRVHRRDLVYTPSWDLTSSWGMWKTISIGPLSNPLQAYTHKMVKMLGFHCSFHTVILGISPLFLLQICRYYCLYITFYSQETRNVLLRINQSKTPSSIPK